MQPKLVLVAALFTAACAPTLRSNQTFLVSEELKVAPGGHASLKSTGETFDLTAIRAQEPAAERVTVIKVHGAYLAVGEGFQKIWRLWPGSRDEMKYEAVELKPGKAGFRSPTLEPAGDCALLKWQRDGSAAQVFLTADGDVHENACSDT